MRRGRWLRHQHGGFFAGAFFAGAFFAGAAFFPSEGFFSLR